MEQCCLKMSATTHKHRGGFKATSYGVETAYLGKAPSGKKHCSWLVPWESCVLLPLWIRRYLLWDPLWHVWTSSEVYPSVVSDQDFGGSKSWFQQPEVRKYSLEDTAVSEEVYLDTRTSFSERLRLIFKLSFYTLIWKSEDNLIFLFSSKLTKRDQYINQASFPTDWTARKTYRNCGKAGFFMNISMSEMLIIQTIRE